MANFETALAGMRRGEKWRMAGWDSENYCTFGSLAGGGVIDPELLQADDWERYEEPKKSLTFEEAVKCKKLRITPPKECTPLYEKHEYIMGRGWSLEELAVLDLAERRGWKVEEVE